MGINAVQGGRMSGAWPLIAVDTVDGRLALARRLGATDTLRADLPEVSTFALFPGPEFTEFPGGLRGDS